MKQCIPCAVLLLAFFGGSLRAQGEDKPDPNPAVQQNQEPEAAEARKPAPAMDLAKAGKHVRQDEGPADADHVWKEFLKDWQGFNNWPLLVSVLVSLLLSVVLALPIAYHPRSWGKASSLEEAEQPKIFMMYGLVGAVVAQIVKAYPSMSLVVFGIGGLLRFRTDTGPARDTGRVILVTCVGLCCGMGLYLVAVEATVFGWLLIYWLERQAAHKVSIKGLEPPILAQAADAYREVLVENGLSVMSEKKNFLKKQVAFVFRAAESLGPDDLEQLFKDIPPKLQGAVDWESS